MRRTADDIFDLLDYCRYPEALALLNASRLSGYETTILRSLIEIETADPEVAAQNVTTILQRQISARERVLCLFALSRVAYIFGRPNGLALLRQAVSLARGIDDAKLLARAHVRLARFALHRFSVEAAM